MATDENREGRPPDPTVGPSSVELFAKLGVTTLLVEPGQLTESKAPTGESGVSRPFRVLGTGGSTITGVSLDPELQQLLGTTSDNPALLAHQMITQMVGTWLADDQARGSILRIDESSDPDVVAARGRYDAVEKRYNEAKDKQSASAGTAEEQLKKLEQFRQFSSEATYPEDLAASHAQYLAAKALIDEIAASGTDVQLQGYSDYSGTKLRVQVWESNRDRVTQSFIDTAREYTVKNAFRQQEWLEKADPRLADLAKVLPEGDARLGEAKSAVAAMRAFIRQEQLEKAAKVFMRPEKYKGKDADALRALAKKAVMTKFPKSAILKVKLVSSGWGPPEGGVQWTDNTRSAIEVRTTSYFSVEVAAREGQDVMLHRVYLYKEKVNGKLQPAKSYVVGSQMMLAQNVK